MSRKGPYLQMQDVLLAAGELNKRERAAVLFAIRRHKEIVGYILAHHGLHATDCPQPPAPCNCGLSDVQERYLEYMNRAQDREP